MGIEKNSMINIEIDGISFSVNSGSNIIEVADDAGIYIPRFCYHKKLSISANCRMCLVEIEKSPKLVPACATLVFNGMKVFTNTSKVIEAQKSVMEFLLINHPLDCPICDQGGECELQDLTVGYGCITSRFDEVKRVVEDYDIGPLVSTDLTRCILCSRCVRFCTEIAGRDEFGIIDRGTVSRIFTFLREQLSSGVSGNVIDLCPVGALTSKPYRYKARSWDLVQYPFISVHDCVGSNLFAHIYKNKVLRIVPRRNEAINEVWISDRDRFSYEGLYSKYRLETPMIKIDDKWIETTWEDAINYSLEKLNFIITKYTSNELCAIASPNSTLEEFYVLQKLFRSLGSNNIDHRIKQIDFDNQFDFPIVPGMDMEISEIDNKEFIFVVGSDIVREQPIIGLRIRKAVNKGGSLFVLNSVDFNFDINIKEKYILNSSNFITILSEIIKVVLVKKSYNIKEYPLFENVKLTEKYDVLISSLFKSKSSLILLGSLISSSPDFSKIISLSVLLSKLTNSNLGLMTDGANSAGGYIAGFLPFRYSGGKNINKNIGLNIKDMILNGLKGYVLFGVDPEFDTFYGFNLLNSLKNSNFVLSFTAFINDTLFNVSDVLLPIASSYENSGTYVNVSNNWQTFKSVVDYPKNAKHGWKAICELAKKLGLSGFDYSNIENIFNEFKQNSNDELVKKISWNYINIDNLSSNIVSNNLINIPLVSEFGVDSLVRRAKSLQSTTNAINSKKTLLVNNVTANKYDIKVDVIYIVSNSKKIAHCLKIDNSVSDNSILINNNCSRAYDSFGFPHNVVYLDNK